MKLASIEEIAAIRPHPNADSLELATILGWQSVVRKGEFSAGDKIVFVVIDTILPSDAPWCEFLRKGDNPIRLKTAKIRGQYSQGLALPISVLPENMQSWQVGADVGGQLGIKKYEKEVPSQLRGHIIGAFPTFKTATTDEDNGLSNLDIVDAVIRHPLAITQKLDGSSMTVIVEDGKIAHVCSRKMDLAETAENAFWIAARKIELSVIAMSMDCHSFVMQGELMGPGIQGNQMALSKPTMFVFQLRPTNTMQWFDYHDMRAILHGSFVDPVPLLAEGVHIDGTRDEVLAQLQETANIQTINGNPAEGIVVRPSKYIPCGNGRPLGFKIINQNYKD